MCVCVCVYCLPYVVMGIELRRMRYAGHVVQMWRRKMHTGFGVGNLRVRPLGDLDTAGT